MKYSTVELLISSSLLETNKVPQRFLRKGLILFGGNTSILHDTFESQRI